MFGQTLFVTSLLTAAPPFPYLTVIVTSPSPIAATNAAALTTAPFFNLAVGSRPRRRRPHRYPAPLCNRRGGSSLAAATIALPRRHRSSRSRWLPSRCPRPPLLRATASKPPSRRRNVGGPYSNGRREKVRIFPFPLFPSPLSPLGILLTPIPHRSSPFPLPPILPIPTK